MGLGGIHIPVYDGNVPATHPYYSVLVGYHEMQSYHDIIKYGTNVIPPEDEARYWYLTSQKTVFYDIGDDDAFVTCRYYGKKVIFVGMSTDGYEKQCTLSNPITGEPIVVKITPYGYVTYYNDGMIQNTTEIVV